MIRALALLMVLSGLMAPTGVMAQSAWETMHPDSFPGTTTAARQQCDRTAGQSASDEVTAAKCEQMELMLATGQCQQTTVPDGTVFDYMNYQHQGESPSVQGRTIKRLGSNETKAAVCNLGNGVTAYWFNEAGVGCNNIAFQFPRQTTILPPTQTAMVAPPLQQTVVPPRAVMTTTTQSSGIYYSVPGITVDTYCAPGIAIPGISGFVPGANQTTTVWKE